MSFTPAFEIGIWNAWIITVFMLFVGMGPAFFLSKERAKQLENMPQYNKAEKISVLATHAFIMPAVAIYSVFLPLKLDTAWLYTGLPICFIGGILMLVAYISIMDTPPDRPFTRGAYRVSRHPLYVGQFLIYVGMGLACASWVILLFAMAWIILWQIAIPAEERDLVGKYGESYREYMNITPRWIGIPKS
ncbi:MAG: isoprenylcysteine carboxylmethyltransferase family protein [Dehalococcoidales bacterium]|nr:MAG: isoprenylcysteine carboxylmethyltransferase family protein [Dehalococcoidales bacterium]